MLLLNLNHLRAFLAFFCPLFALSKVKLSISLCESVEVFQEEAEEDPVLAPHWTFFPLSGVLGFWKSSFELVELSHELAESEVGSL